MVAQGSIGVARIVGNHQYTSALGSTPATWMIRALAFETYTNLFGGRTDMLASMEEPVVLLPSGNHTAPPALTSAKGPYWRATDFNPQLSETMAAVGIYNGGIVLAGSATLQFIPGFHHVMDKIRTTSQESFHELIVESATESRRRTCVHLADMVNTTFATEFAEIFRTESFTKTISLRPGDCVVHRNTVPTSLEQHFSAMSTNGVPSYPTAPFLYQPVTMSLVSAVAAEVTAACAFRHHHIAASEHLPEVSPLSGSFTYSRCFRPEGAPGRYPAIVNLGVRALPFEVASDGTILVSELIRNNSLVRFCANISVAPGLVARVGALLSSSAAAEDVESYLTPTTPPADLPVDASEDISFPTQLEVAPGDHAPFSGTAIGNFLTHSNPSSPAPPPVSDDKITMPSTSTVYTTAIYP